VLLRTARPWMALVCCAGSSRALTGSAVRLYACQLRDAKEPKCGATALRGQSDEMARAPVGVGSQVLAAPWGHGMDALVASHATQERTITPSTKPNDTQNSKSTRAPAEGSDPLP
jgi:hypothetical protein